MSGVNFVSVAIWQVIIFVSFLFILFFVSEPEFVKEEDGEVSKKMCLWYAIVGAVVMGLLFTGLYYMAVGKKVDDAAAARGMTPAQMMSQGQRRQN